MKAYYVVDNCGEIEKSNTIELDNLSKEDLSVYAMGLMFDSGYTNQIPFAIYINDGSGYECYETNNANLEEKIYESFFASGKSEESLPNKPTMTTDSHGTKSWHLNGKLHRTDSPAIEYADGHKEWWLNGKLHRTDGPAIEHASGTKSWHLNGNLHRIGGPAIEYADGHKSWYLNGKKLTESEFNEQTGNNK